MNKAPPFFFIFSPTLSIAWYHFDQVLLAFAILWDENSLWELSCSGWTQESAPVFPNRPLLCVASGDLPEPVWNFGNLLSAPLLCNPKLTNPPLLSARLPEALRLWDQVQKLLFHYASSGCVSVDRFCVTQWHASHSKYLQCWQKKSALPAIELSLLGGNGEGAWNINATKFLLPLAPARPLITAQLSVFFLLRIIGGQRELGQGSEGHDCKMGNHFLLGTVMGTPHPSILCQWPSHYASLAAKYSQKRREFLSTK